jgi:hypothetical protein
MSENLNFEELMNDENGFRFRLGSTEVNILNDVNETKVFFLYIKKIMNFTMKERILGEESDMRFSFKVKPSGKDDLYPLIRGLINELKGEKIVLYLYDYHMDENGKGKLIPHVSYFATLKGGISTKEFGNPVSSFLMIFDIAEKPFTDINQIK